MNFWQWLVLAAMTTIIITVAIVNIVTVIVADMEHRREIEEMKRSVLKRRR